METAYYIKPFQESSVSIFMDKYGIDAGIEMIIEFEKHGDLGKAMLDTVRKIKKQRGKP